MGLNRDVGKDVSILWEMCCQIEVSATAWGHVQRSLIERGVSECDREAP